MVDIKEYVYESLQQNRVHRWNKKVVTVYITSITNPLYKNQQQEYNALIKEGLAQWNKIIGNKVKFQITQDSTNPDIVVRFPRVTNQYWGMCYYDNIQNGEYKKLTVKIGLSNEYNGAKLTPNEKLVLVLHEFGHALGLGHSIGKNIMTAGYYPEKNWISIVDIITLKILYDLPAGAYYEDVKDDIKNLSKKYQDLFLNKSIKDEKNMKNGVEQNNIQMSLEEIGNLNLYKISLEQNVQLPPDYLKIMNDQQLKNYNTQNDKDSQ